MSVNQELFLADCQASIKDGKSIQEAFRVNALRYLGLPQNLTDERLKVGAEVLKKLYQGS